MSKRPTPVCPVCGSVDGVTVEIAERGDGWVWRCNCGHGFPVEFVHLPTQLSDGERAYLLGVLLETSSWVVRAEQDVTVHSLEVLIDRLAERVVAIRALLGMPVDPDEAVAVFDLAGVAA